MKQINFKRRCAKDAHPIAQEIAKPMHEAFIKRICGKNNGYRTY